MTALEAPVEGKLALNILYFARALRAAGLPVGPGSVMDAVSAVEAAGIGAREDFYATLHAVFVKRHEHTLLFDQAFQIFWRTRGFSEKLMSMLSPMAQPNQPPQKPKAGANRVADAMFKKRDEPKKKDVVELDMRLTMSSDEILQSKDFAQMSAEEIARAFAAIDRLELPENQIRTRRFQADARGLKLDPRRSFRRSLRAGGSGIELARRSPALRHPPIVALCDISGSMSDYTRVFLHFMHVLTARRKRVQTFLFGTRLTNITRSLRARDIDVALENVSSTVADWSGGTRIATSLHEFNRTWSRRVLGQGAIVLLFTDGLERDGGIDLPHEMERLHMSSRKLVWLNPLLRFDKFEAKAQGIRIMLPHVDEFRPIHNLDSIADLCDVLGRDANTAHMSSRHDPRSWMRTKAAQ